MRRWVFALAVCALGALGNLCPVAWRPLDVRILTPKKDAVLTRMPLTIEFDMGQNADVGSLEVRLNGFDVTGLFTLEPPAQKRILAWADFVWNEAWVKAGSNEIAVTVEFPDRTAQARRSFRAVGDPYADAVVDVQIGADGGFKAAFLPDIALGPPQGAGLFQGSLDVVSLGLGGSIELEFVDNVIVDGPGVDLLVFENPFLEDDGSGFTAAPFMEPGRVSVSQDGVTWFSFPCALDPAEAPQFHPGCAGVYPVLSASGTPHPSIPSEVPIEDLVGQEILFLQVPEGAGGDGFDLADVGLGWARYLRVESAGFATYPAVAPVVGFDFDAAAAVNSAPATDADADGIPDAVE
jgi:hypothetical protein